MPRSDAKAKLEKLKDKIGKVTDAEVAEEASVSIGSVRLYRKRHGIAAAKVRRVKKAPKAAKVPKAAKASKTAKAVKASKTAKAVKASKAVKAPKAAKASKASKTAKAVKAPKTTAQKRRNTRGKDQKPRRSKVGALRHLLGQIPDSDVAAQAGVSVEAVRMYRRRHAITSPQSQSAPVATPRRRKSALDPYFDLLGTVPDSEIAAMAGVTNENVRAFRRRHGIDAGWKGARTRKVQSKAAMPVVPAGAVSAKRMGYLVTFEGQEDHVVMASDFVSAARIAVESGSGRVLGLRILGPVIG